MKYAIEVLTNYQHTIKVKWKILILHKLFCTISAIITYESYSCCMIVFTGNLFTSLVLDIFNVPQTACNVFGALNHSKSISYKYSWYYNQNQTRFGFLSRKKNLPIFHTVSSRDEIFRFICFKRINQSCSTIAEFTAFKL